MISAFVLLVIAGGALVWFLQKPTETAKKTVPAGQVKRDRFKGAMETDLRTLRTKPGENPQFGRR